MRTNRKSSPGSSLIAVSRQVKLLCPLGSSPAPRWAAATMEVSDGQSSARVVNNRVYVAVGRDVPESKSTLLWALNNFGGDFGIIHVHQPHQLNPSSKCSGSKVMALPC
ncbi:uncharacterized protein J3R85_006595 [Psidium guajava]|nr:uncharacterized protein J3R85_006595 [Psidium guajava]